MHVRASRRGKYIQIFVCLMSICMKPCCRINRKGDTAPYSLYIKLPINIKLNKVVDEITSCFCKVLPDGAFLCLTTPPPPADARSRGDP